MSPLRAHSILDLVELSIVHEGRSRHDLIFSVDTNFTDTLFLHIPTEPSGHLPVRDGQGSNVRVVTSIAPWYGQSASSPAEPRVRRGLLSPRTCAWLVSWPRVRSAHLGGNDRWDTAETDWLPGSMEIFEDSLHLIVNSHIRPLIMVRVSRPLEYKSLKP